MPSWLKTWPHGRTWVFQGTVAEDATGGTHICTLTVTPGAGNELEVRYGSIIVGNTATAQIAEVRITDGTNLITFILNPEEASNTSANETYVFPQSGSVSAALMGTNIDSLATSPGIVISGTMALVLRTQTTAISVTQTFAVACRIMGALPTATLADTVGTPTLTTNTNQVF